MPTLGPDNRLMYFPHEAFNLVGNMKFGPEWKDEYHPHDKPNLGLTLDDETNSITIDDRKALDMQHIEMVRTDDCLSYIEIIMASGWVVCWVKRNEMWSVYEPTHFQADHDHGDRDGKGLRFFVHWLKKVMVNGEGPDGQFVIDKSSFDRTLETVGPDVEAFIKRGFRGVGGNTPTHDKNIWKQLIAEILFENSTPDSNMWVAKEVVRRLRATKYAVPEVKTVSNYIQFLRENNEI